jgi:hypothetical protein
MALMMLQNTQNFFEDQSKSAINNIQLANSGINYALGDNSFTSDTLTLPYLGSETQSVKVNLSLWGIFDLANVRATHRKKVFNQCALIGSQTRINNKAALYLQDNNKSLAIAGRASLNGTIYLPGQGIKPGYVNGESYNNQQLYHGIAKRSKPTMPRLEKIYERDLRQFIAKKHDYNRLISTDNPLKLANSFTDRTKTIFSTGPIELSQRSLTGNIIIQSDFLIRVKNTSLLNDVILLAPVIEIEDGVVGNFQAIATRSITVGENCKLNYPSALVLLQESSVNVSPGNTTEYQIRIAKKSEIFGSVCFLKSIIGNDFKVQLLVSDEVVVKGEVYCQGNLELRGKVIGSVTTEQFIVNEQGTLLINYIYNGEIMESGRPETFCGLRMEDAFKGIAKWMY